MNHQYWHQKWASDNIGFDQKKPNTLMQRYFPSLNLKPGARIFVPLCGKSIDMLWFLKQGYDVIGIELSSVACEAFFSENNLPVNMTKMGDFDVYTSHNITLLAGDFFKLDKQMLGKVDGVYDRASLIALPTTIRQSYALHLSQLLKPGAQMLVITTAYDKTTMQGPPFSVDEDEIKHLFSPSFDIQQWYSKPLRDIPAHLQTKGLLEATEQLYYLRVKEI
ncbi:MAG: thiopurine S-methyltransferase [Gammaproteobacteria bacterium]|nr:thiopurine S-methyltransferase [Gammaproteobacteria bacterium]